VAPLYGGEGGVRERLARAEPGAVSYAQGKEPPLVPAYAPGDDHAGMSMAMGYYASPERGNVPTWRNEMSELTWAHWLTYDAFAAAAGVQVPTLFVHSENAVLPNNVRSVTDRLGDLATLDWTDGEQTDFYDVPEQVDHAVDAAIAHFDRTLRSKR
jgi:uncharacterized protein